MNLDECPIAYGMTAEIYTWNDGQVLKLFHEGFSRSTVETEANLTRIAHTAGVPVPVVGKILDVNGRLGLEYERIDGISMLEAMQQRPWKFIPFAHQLAKLQADMHRVHVPAMPSQRQRLERKLKNAAPLPENLRQAALKKLESLPIDDRLCHGDFHPGNILLTPHGPVIIDWLDATSGSPLLDLARSVLLMGGTSLPPGTPRPWLVNLIRRGFGTFYLRRYRQLNVIEKDQIAKWLPVVAAARLEEGVSDDESRLLAMARKLLD